MSELQCPSHPTANLIEDHRAGDLICPECGLVVGDRLVDVSSEWRMFSNESNSKDPSRVGAAENSLLSGSDLSTSIQGIPGASEEYAGMARRQVNSQDRQLIAGFGVIREMSERIHLPKSIQDSANSTLKQVVDSRQLKGKNGEAIAAACLYIACRKEGVPRTFKAEVRFQSLPLRFTWQVKLQRARKMRELLYLKTDMMNTSYHIANLLDKMTSADKDFRFMATNDLMSELQKDAIKLDEDCERKIVRMLLKLLEDKNGEVQNLAVKCMGPLVNKVKEHHVEVIVDTLCANMLSDQEQLRDVSSIGLKTVIDQLPSTGNALTCNTCRRVTPKIVAAVNGGPNADVAIQLEGLDILADLLLRYGVILSSFHQCIQEALIPLLSSSRLAVRKRAITALAYLVSVCNLNQFNSVCDSLLTKLKNCQDISVVRTYVNCIGAVSKSSGARFGAYFPRVIPALIEFCDGYDDDELREGCLQTFESIILKCPKESVPHIPAILTLCSKYLCHDPNYHYGDNGVNGEESNMDVDGAGDVSNAYGETSFSSDDIDKDENYDDEDEQQQEYSDDDDMSWKVRRASAKCLEAALSTRRELLPAFYRETGPLLISRFKEREENVKADIFRAYVSLLKHTKIVVPVPDAKYDENGLLDLLRQQLPKLVRAVSRQMKEKSLKTKQCCFALLIELLRVLPGALNEYMSSIMPGVKYALTDKLANSNTKIDALSFLNVALTTHSPQIFHPFINVLVPLIVNAVNDPFYKVTAEALSVVQQLVKVLRPFDLISPSNNNFSWPPFVDQLFLAVFDKLKTTDIDQEVKERAISCTGHLLATFGDYLQKEIPTCLSVLLDRLKNEVTRLTAVRAIITICQSSLKINLQPIFAQMVNELSEFLRKNQRSLRLSTLQLLSCLTNRYENLFSQDLMQRIIIELPALISESDLQIAQMAVELLTDLLRVNPGCVASSLQPCMASVIRLIQSPLLQGSSLNTIRKFLTALITARLEWPKFAHLRDILTKTAYDIAQSTTNVTTPVIASSSSSHHIPSTTSVHGSINHRQAYQNSAKCLAGLVATCPDQAETTLNDLINNLRENSKCNDFVQLFSLLALGEIGRECPGVIENRQVELSIMRGFQAHNEETKSAASQALGSLAVGNLSKYLPFVLNEIQLQPKRQYLLLHSLKEIISSESASAQVDSILSIFKPHIDQIWNVLISHAECVEEGVRNVVAECLGKLCFLDPSTLVPRLKSGLTSETSAYMRATIVTSLKFTIVDQPQSFDTVLKEYIGDFLKSIDDADLNVRRVALITLNSTAHNKPALIRDCLSEILPGVYRETKIRKDLIREVEMGPFRHTVDDGLDLRKSAFECMYTLLETCLERLDIFEFLQHVEDGLKDHYDIKMLTYLMLIRLANLCPTQVLQRLDRLVEPLKQTCSAKVKANAVKQEFEKQDELKRCALRSIVALQSVAESDKNAHLNELLQIIKTTPDLFHLYENVQKDFVSRAHYDVVGHSMDVD